MNIWYFQQETPYLKCNLYKNSQGLHCMYFLDKYCKWKSLDY